ncbi:hypothetical protein DEJ03_10640 [Curtobacterium sp. MCLR17_043]|nr:hypothetical protein DEJ03_10640 [Curtobacterium sp. MCLR17_043]
MTTWHRFTWAVTQRPDMNTYDISTTVLRDLETVPWWSKADRRLASRALRRRAIADQALDDDERRDPD